LLKRREGALGVGKGGKGGKSGFLQKKVGAGEKAGEM